jgi:hypothetical protein
MRFHLGTILSFPGFACQVEFGRRHGVHIRMEIPPKKRGCRNCDVNSEEEDCDECKSTRCKTDGCMKKGKYLPHQLCEDHTPRCSKPGCTRIAESGDEETCKLRICYAHMYPCENPGGCELGNASATLRNLCFYHDPKSKKCSTILPDGRRCPKFDYRLKRCPIHDPAPQSKRSCTRVPGRKRGRPRKESKIPPPEPVVYKLATQEQVNKISRDLMDDIMNGKFTHATFERNMYRR